MTGGRESGSRLNRSKLLVVGRVEVVAVRLREGLEILRLAAAHRGEGFVYCFAIGLIAFFEDGVRQVGGILRGRRRQTRLVGAGVARRI